VPPTVCAVAPVKVMVFVPAVKAVVEALFVQLPATPKLKLLALRVPAVTVRFPFMVVAAPNVTVPAGTLTVRLL